MLLFSLKEKEQRRAGAGCLANSCSVGGYRLAPCLNAGVPYAWGPRKVDVMSMTKLPRILPLQMPASPQHPHASTCRLASVSV